MSPYLNGSCPLRNSLEIYLFALSLNLLAVAQSPAATNAAADSTYAAVFGAYNAGATGDTITIPSGECQSEKGWDQPEHPSVMGDQNQGSWP